MINKLLFDLMVRRGGISIGQMEELEEVENDLDNKDLTKFLLVEALSAD